MPIVVQSALGAAANGAAAFLQGQQERAATLRSAALAQQKQDSESALQQAQAQMYLGHGDLFNAQGAQRTALTPSMIAKNVAGAAMQDAHGNLYSAQGDFITGPQTNYETAKTGLTTAQTGLANANTGLTNAKTQVQLQGELPFLKSKTTLTNSLPGYNAARINALNNATGERGFAAAQATAARINVAGLDNQSRIVLGSMVNDRLAEGQSESEAMKGALEQYQLGVQTYNQATRTNAGLVEKGLPSGPTPTMPTLQNPQQSQGGVNLTLNLPSQSIGQGPNGQPTYTRQPARTINLPGEIASLKGALNDTKKDPNKVVGIFNNRTDLSAQQKANILAAAGAPNPGSGSFLPTPGAGAAGPSSPSVSGGLFGLPQTPYSFGK